MIILIMAQPSITTPFRVTLLKVGECLTEQNVQDLAFLCEDIKPARRELLRNARELFVELQGHDLLNERNVKVLIGWLDELRLLEASKYLKDYGQKYLQGKYLFQTPFKRLIAIYLLVVIHSAIVCLISRSASKNVLLKFSHARESFCTVNLYDQ